QLEAAHPAESAFRLVSEGTEAFVTRIQMARLAERSLDVQSYIWHSDLTGAYFAQELLLAADRGVKVRVLLDDMDARKRNDAIAALAAHPGIEVRTFNPYASRKGTFSFLTESLFNFSRINRRMHNKSWITDNRLAIAGGRNVGDEYFGANEDVNFVDLDFAMIGPVVRDVSASFDRYWNSASAYPMELLDGKRVTSEALQKLRTYLDTHAAAAEGARYRDALRADQGVRQMLAGEWPMHWASNYRFVADDPAKITMKKDDPRVTQVGAVLQPMMQGTQQQLSVISPYFVPGKGGTAFLSGIAQTGKEVGVLTNSLVANDVAAVHGGYSRSRQPLLKGGVKLWELKPLKGESTDSSMFGSSGASLHTKAFAVDGKILFVGSYNVDPRSTWLNCEQGVMVENEALAKQLEGIFTLQTSGAHAWSVTINGDELAWNDGTEQFDSDPKASTGRRFQAWLLRVLHLDAQL
ncbi:MAG TPA: phospholipase D family protein, partial [Steroidobacteraceae bacterium]|nr:phospholipase D family protein [Steroidobacteraceae bacterium]